MTPDVGVAAILGIGSYKGRLVLEVGGQYNYYLFGSFNHGMQIGAEMMYVYIGVDLPYEEYGIHDGLVISPFLGYKIAADFGLTFNTQVGPALVMSSAYLERLSDGAFGALQDVDVGVMLNINVGWSF